jgi:hypothetical protein
LKLHRVAVIGANAVGKTAVVVVIVVVIIVIIKIPYAFGNRQLAKLVSRHNTTATADINNVVCVCRRIITRIIYAVIVGLRNGIIIAVYVTVIILVAVVVAAAVAGIISIGVIIAGTGTAVTVTRVGVLLLAADNHTTVGRLPVRACNGNRMIRGTGSGVGISRVKS